MSYSTSGEFGLKVVFVLSSDHGRAIKLKTDKPIMLCGLSKEDVKRLHPGSPYCLDQDSSSMGSKYDTLSWDMEHYWMTTRSKKSAKKKWGEDYIYIEGVYLDF